MNFNIRKLYFLILLSFLFLISSCYTKELVDTKLPDKPEYKTSYFNQTCKSYIFKTYINIYNNDFSGIIVIKPVEDDSYRIVFLNELGMKFFDIEISPDSFIKHKIFESLNRKSLINLLVRDFKLLLYNKVDLVSSDKYLEKEGVFYVFRPKNTKNLLFINKDEGLLSKIEQYSIFRKINIVEFKNFKNKFPENILILHKNIKFAIELSLIEIRK